MIVGGVAIEIGGKVSIVGGVDVPDFEVSKVSGGLPAPDGAVPIDVHSDVKVTSTVNRRSKRPKRDVETTGPKGFIPAAARFIRAAGRRAGEGDEFELAELVGLQAVLDAAIAEAVAGQRTYGKSWAAIGRAVHTTREAAWQRWGKS